MCAGVGAQSPATRVEANLGQLMKGILYPASHVIFAAQNENPADVKSATPDASTATNPLASAYGQWQAVENAGLALAESANLLTIPGRKCANGRDVPLKNPDWAKFVQGLREAGRAAYKAAQSKNQDNILDAADKMTTACSNCHEKYREKARPADRCM
jgi:cytochrome c556